MRLDRSRHAGPLSLLTGLILFANFPALSGLFNCDPGLFLSGLATGTRRYMPGLPNWYDPNIGFTVQALGHLAAEDWLHGIVPWWNPYSGVGMPLAAEMQNYAMFLPFVLLLHFHAGWLWLRVLMQIFAGSFTYILATELEFCRFAALLTGLMYGCMGSFVVLAHAPAATFPCLPLLLIGIEHIRRASKNGHPGGWSLVTLAVAWSAYAGFPETALFGNLLGGFWLIVRSNDLPPYAIPHFLSKFLIAVTLALMLAAPCLLPFFEYLLEGALGGHTASNDLAHLPLIGLAIEWLPQLFGPLGIKPPATTINSGAATLDTLYNTWGGAGGWFGSLPLMLALAGVLTKINDRPVKWLLIGWFIFWQLRMFGFWGTIALLNILMPFRYIAIDRYAEPSCDFVLILLAGLFLDGWRRVGYLASKASIATFWTLVCLIASVLVAQPALTSLWKSIPFLRTYTSVYLELISLSLLAGIILMLRRPVPAIRALFACLVVAFTLSGFSVSQFSGAVEGYIDLSGVAYLKENLQLYRAFSLGPIAPNYSAAEGLAEIDHNALPVPKLWTDFVKEKLDSNANQIIFNGNSGTTLAGVTDQGDELISHLAAYESIGVRYVITEPNKSPFVQKSAPPMVFHNDVMDVYELSDPAPYYSVHGAACRLIVMNRLSVVSDCQARATLMRLELMYPGWWVDVNGQAAPIHQTNEIFQSVDLPKGISHLRFYYRPPHELIAVFVAFFGCCLWIGFFIDAFQRRRSIMSSNITE